MTFARRIGPFGRAAIFVVVAAALHVATFIGLGSLFPGSVYLTTLALGFALGPLAWVLFRDHLGARFWPVFGLALLLILIAAGLLLLAGLETAICLVIGLPLCAPGVALGILAVRRWQRGRDGGSKVHVVLLGLPLMVAALEAQVAYPSSEASVTTRIDIAAPPAAVWAQTLDIAPIRAGERVWTLSHYLLGAPQPVSAELHGDRRNLRWTRGVHFTEILTARDENRHLAWRFVFDAPESLAAFDPHVSPDSDRLRLTRGAYRLEETATGTRLTLQSHYRLRTPFNRYLGLWGARFLTDFHFSVLSVIKTRAEAQARRGAAFPPLLASSPHEPEISP